MKKRIFSIILLILPAVALFISVCLYEFDGGASITKYGCPPYIEVEYKEVPYNINEKTIIDFKNLNLIAVFFSLSVPVFFSGYLWAKSKKELLSVIGEKKILIMPFHSWDGDSVKHLSSTFSFLSLTNPANVRVCLGYLDFCNPKIREIYNSYGWRIECAGVRASKHFGSPVGGREEFLYQLFDILNWSDIVLGDELNTGMLYAVCLGKKIGLLPSNAQFEYDYSKWTNSVAAQEIQNKVRLLFPWLIGELISPQIIKNDLFSALGIEKFTNSEKLVTLLPWYLEKSLP
jgi:hypothetical protein